MSTSGGSGGGGGGEDRLPVGDPTGLTTLDTYVNPVNPMPDIPVTTAVYVPTTGDGSALDVAYAWQLEGDAFPRVVVLTNGSQYFGDGTTDPVVANPALAKGIIVDAISAGNLVFAASGLIFLSPNPIGFQAATIGALVAGTSAQFFCAIQLLAVATADRPDPTTLPAGSQIYDTDLSLPIWTDGTAWNNALGVPV